MSDVDRSWRISPLTHSCTRRSWAFSISSRVTMAGPMGAKVSHDFCQKKLLLPLGLISRAETSMKLTYPKM